MDDKSKSGREILWGVSVLLSALLVCAFVFSAGYIKDLKDGKSDRNGVADVTSDVSDTHPARNFGDSEASELEHIADDTPAREVVPYECPKELADAVKNNPDVYAWLSITDTEISYPICNRAGNNKFYLNHSDTGMWNPMGAIFTEDYNARDFSDNVVVAYGHSMTGTKFFGTLQKSFSDREFFDSHREIKVWLEDRELTYTIFAAVPYSNAHIMYYFDFTDEKSYNSFFGGITMMRSLDSIIDSDIFPEFDDKVLILSTCLKGNNDKRFLVLAVLNDET